jgi:hypothetical protein
MWKCLEVVEAVSMDRERLPAFQMAAGALFCG